MAETSIEWATKVWNPVVGCSVISPGCTNCYAQRMAGRLERMGSPIYKGLTQKTKAGDVWTGRVEASNWGKMIEPLRWKKPERIFVNSMSDLFHENLADEVIDQVFAVMALCPQHTFMVLTKRADRMRAYFAGHNLAVRVWLQMCNIADNRPQFQGCQQPAWPLPNVWLGISAEDQERADLRIPDLLATTAAVRFVSAEPLLGSIDFRPFLWASNSLDNPTPFPMLNGPRRGESIVPAERLHLVIAGGESGPGARPCNVTSIRSIVDQCRDVGVACFVKQLGRRPYWDLTNGCGKWPALTRIELDGKQVDAISLKDRKGGDMAEWPEDLRIRELPA
jgi:protein gp37